MLSAIVVATERTPWSDRAMALLPWRDDETLIEFQVEQLRAAGVRDIEVVLGHHAEHIIPLVAGGNVEPIVNPAWQSDRATSWRTGASAVVRGTDSAILLEVGEPRPAPLIRTLIDAHGQDAGAITRPTFDGTAGSPLVVGAEALATLRNVRGDAPLVALMSRFAGQIRDVPFDTDIVMLRIDSEETYERTRDRLV